MVMTIRRFILTILTIGKRPATVSAFYKTGENLGSAIFLLSSAGSNLLLHMIENIFGNDRFMCILDTKPFFLWLADYLMVLCNSQREEGLVPSQICRTSNRVIPQNYKINLEPIFNFLRLFYLIIVEKASMSRSAEKTFFTSAQVAQKLFFIMLLLDKLARSCTLGNAQNERAAIIER